MISIDDDDADVTVRHREPQAERESTRAPERSPNTGETAEPIQRDSFPPAEFNGPPPDLPERFDFQQLLGAGATSFVLSVSDRDLKRDVAIKLLRDDVARDPEGLQRFVHEGQVTARLEHPNIIPVYDVKTSNELTYLVMRRVRGEALGRLIRRAKREGRFEIMPLNELVTVFLKVCDAVAYAHDRGVVHRDVKPDNIMVGQFGEVMLVDWGAACSATTDDGLFVGTPHYMSPERAAGGPATPGNDVYALGATLFYALVLRRPLEGEEREQFWLKKASGELNLPTDEERARVPKALLEIALQALHRDPLERYPSALALANAIRDYQAGRVAWSAPFLVETFGDDWETRWAAARPTQFRRIDGGVETMDGWDARLYFRKRLATSVAIEFQGRIEPGAKPGDLSVIWTENDMFAGGQLEPNALFLPGRTYGLQVGALSNAFAAIFRQFHTPLAGRRFKLEVGRDYVVRAEIDERTLRLFVDGELVAEHEELFPFSSGYLALFGFYPGKSFRRVRLYSKGYPERVSPIVVGDEFFKADSFEAAAHQYQRVADTHFGTHLADEATYKVGLCQYQVGKRDEARRTWSGLKNDLYRGYAELQTIDDAAQTEDYAAALEGFRKLYAENPAVRPALRRHWSDYVLAVIHSPNRPPKCWPRVRPFIDLRKELFANDPLTADAAASALDASGRWQEVLDDYPENLFQRVWSLFALGRTREVLEKYEYVSFIRDEALLRLGRLSELKPGDDLYNFALLLEGKVDEAVTNGPSIGTILMIAAGRPEEALAQLRPEDGPSNEAMALRRLGRLDEAVALGDVTSLLYADRFDDALARSRNLDELRLVSSYRAVDSYARGDRGEYERMLAELETIPYSWRASHAWFSKWFALPFLRWLDGDQEAMQESCRFAATHMGEVLSLKPTFFARLILGEIDEAGFDAQPVKFQLEARKAVALALRAELAGRRGDALAHYQSFQALPLMLKSFDEVTDDPVLDRFITWRIEALSRG